MIELKPEMSVADLAQPEVATPVSSAKSAPPREFPVSLFPITKNLCRQYSQNTGVATTPAGAAVEKNTKSVITPTSHRAVSSKFTL